MVVSCRVASCLQNLLIEAVAYRRSFAENNMSSIEVDAKVMYTLLFISIIAIVPFFITSLRLLQEIKEPETLGCILQELLWQHSVVLQVYKGLPQR